MRLAAAAVREQVPGCPALMLVRARREGPAARGQQMVLVGAAACCCRRPWLPPSGLLSMPSSGCFAPGCCSLQAQTGEAWRAGRSACNRSSGGSGGSSTTASERHEACGGGRTSHHAAHDDSHRYRGEHPDQDQALWAAPQRDRPPFSEVACPPRLLLRFGICCCPCDGFCCGAATTIFRSHTQRRKAQRGLGCAVGCAAGRGARRRWRRRRRHGVGLLGGGCHRRSAQPQQHPASRSATPGGRRQSGDTAAMLELSRACCTGRRALQCMVPPT